MTPSQSEGAHQEDANEVDAEEKDNLARSNKKVKIASGDHCKGRENLQKDQEPDQDRRKTYKDLVLGSTSDVLMEVVHHRRKKTYPMMMISTSKWSLD